MRRSWQRSLPTGFTIPLETIRGRATDADPTLNGDPAARDRIRSALDRLVTESVITYPSTGNRDAWDVRSIPPLPRGLPASAPDGFQRPPIRGLASGRTPSNKPD